PRDEQQTWLAGSLRSCTASLQQAAGNQLWAGGCHPVLMRAGQSLDQARLAEAYLAAGRAGEAIPWFERMVADRAGALGPDHPGTAAARRELGHALVAAGQLGAAVTV